MLLPTRTIALLHHTLDSRGPESFGSDDLHICIIWVIWATKPRHASFCMQPCLLFLSVTKKKHAFPLPLSTIFAMPKPLKRDLCLADHGPRSTSCILKARKLAKRKKNAKNETLSESFCLSFGAPSATESEPHRWFAWLQNGKAAPDAGPRGSGRILTALYRILLNRLYRD